MAQNSSIVVFNQLIKMKDSVQHASDQLSKISALLQKIARPAQFSDFNSTTARKIQSSLFKLDNFIMDLNRDVAGLYADSFNIHQTCASFDGQISAEKV